MTSDWPVTLAHRQCERVQHCCDPSHKREEVRNAPRWAARERPRPSLDVEQGGPRFDGLDLDRRHRLRCYVEDDNRTHGRAAPGDDLARVPGDEGGTDSNLVTFSGVEKETTTVELHGVDAQVNEHTESLGLDDESVWMELSLIHI